MILFSANEDFKGDERVINIMRDSYAEEKNNSDETPTRPKSSSFLTRSGSFTTKGKEKGNTRRLDDDRERENSRDDKLLQQFNKNVSCFFFFTLPLAGGIYYKD